MNPFESFIQEYAVYGYPVLFFGVLLENAGVPVPGETAVLVAGFMSSKAGGGHFNLVTVVLLTVCAAVLGDNLGFWLGHRFARPRLQNGQRFLFLTPKTLQLAEGYFERYGLWTIFFARFIAGLRVIGALAAGTAGMHWTRFLIANTAGAVVWAITMSLLGYFFGHSWELLHHWIGRGGLILLGCVAVLAGLPYLLRRLRHMDFRHLDILTRAQIVQGLIVSLLEMICIGVLVLLASRKHDTALDRHVREWLVVQKMPLVDDLAWCGAFIGSLPVMAALTGLLLLWLRYQGRSWGEQVALVWTLLGSQAVGLFLVALLRMRSVIPVLADVWPRGFAGLIPIRAFAVFGMAAYLIAPRDRVWRWLIRLTAATLTVLAGFSVVWTGEQHLTETLLEYAAGAIVLFAALWWLEGYGPGLTTPETEVQHLSKEGAYAPRSPSA